jgi:circadian clock protein KaiC
MTADRGGGGGPAFARVPSGVPGLDAVLGGGFLRGGVYILRGAPGTGKTTLGHQLCFAHIRTARADGPGGPGGVTDAAARGAARGGASARALYVTLLAENHARMMAHLGAMRFFDAAAVPDRLYYVSAFRTLEEEGLRGLVGLLRKEAARLGAGVVVLDGLVAAADAARDGTEFKRFIHDLQAVAGAVDRTVFLLTSAGAGDAAVTPEQTMVDGIVELTRLPRDALTERRLEVHKFRGSDHLDGRHTLRITGDGVVVHPRFEAIHGDPPEEDPDGGRVTTGVADLDAALHGGLPGATSTLVVGPSGAGKTTLGLHFLAASTAAEPGLLFGFYETPPRLRVKARALGLDLDHLLGEGRVELLWQAPTERELDALGHRLVGAVRRLGARRVLVDGLGGFLEGAAEPERLKRFFAALANALRAAGATTLFTVETPRLFGTEVELPMTGVSAVAENMLLMRLVEQQGRLRRTLAALKVRDSDFEPSLMGFAIGPAGIALTPGAFEDVEAATTGVARRRSNARARGAGPAAALARP